MCIRDGTGRDPKSTKRTACVSVYVDWTYTEYVHNATRHFQIQPRREFARENGGWLLGGEREPDSRLGRYGPETGGVFFRKAGKPLPPPGLLWVLIKTSQNRRAPMHVVVLGLLDRRLFKTFAEPPRHKANAFAIGRLRTRLYGAGSMTRCFVCTTENGERTVISL